MTHPMLLALSSGPAENIVGNVEKIGHIAGDHSWTGIENLPKVPVSFVGCADIEAPDRTESFDVMDVDTSSSGVSEGAQPETDASVRGQLPFGLAHALGP